jgi:hypothetical protein
MNILMNLLHSIITKTSLSIVYLFSILFSISTIYNKSLTLSYQQLTNSYYNNIIIACLGYSIITIFYLMCYTSACPQHPKNKYHSRLFCPKVSCYCKASDTIQCVYPLECTLFNKTCSTLFAVILLLIIFTQI